MLKQDVEKALSELEQKYGSDICCYVRRVIYSELKNNGEDPEDLISIAYIVLEKTKMTYISEFGAFKNYAIRSLKNEFLKLKIKKEILYEDFVNEDNENVFQASKGDHPYRYQKIPKDDIHDHFDATDIVRSSVAVVAVLQSKLTALERALIYSMYYSLDDNRKPSLRKFSIEYPISYSVLLTRLRSSLEKLRRILTNSKIRLEEIQELLK